MEQGYETVGIMVRHALLAAGLAMAGCAATPQAALTAQPIEPNQSIQFAQYADDESGREAMRLEAAHHGLEEALGIKIAGIRLSAAGYMIDFRYRVTDPAKAAPLLDRKIKPYLFDEGGGAQLAIPDTPKLGQLRSSGRSKVMPDRNYYIMFANPGRYLKPGSKVTLVLGDLKVENLSVE
ncbi:MAG: hypothetical protein ACOY4U_04600 [Pseudomonadota bacterium]